MKPSEESQSQKTDSIIGPKIRLKGQVIATGNLVINGTVEGSVAHDKHVFIGRRAHVSGEVSGQTITVEGTFDGTLAAEDVVWVKKTANLTGKISAPRITLDRDYHISHVTLAGRIERSISS